MRSDGSTRGDMTKPIIILGTGGNCIDILDTLLAINEAHSTPKYECRGFLDDNDECWGREFYGVPVLGPLSKASAFGDCCFVNGIGSTSNFWKKREIIAKTNVGLDRFETIVHPTAYVSRMARVGHGTVILQHVTVASNVTIGNHIMILPNAVLNHDVVVGDYTCITTGVSVSGRVRVGTSSYLGTNCAIRSGLQIGDCSLVGMGSVVLDDVPDNTVVVGNPARVLRSVRTGS